ncbi:hypothetical protein EXW96_16930 [Paenibacillus sp. JMULE4]|nr:hypothetical protein [Paenibacillus sp. JMULE4]
MVPVAIPNRPLEPVDHPVRVPTDASGQASAALFDGLDGLPAYIRVRQQRSGHRCERVGCWAHTRHKFVETVQALPKTRRLPARRRSRDWTSAIASMRLSEKPKGYRQEQSRPVLDAVSFGWRNKKRGYCPKV